MNNTSPPKQHLSMCIASVRQATRLPALPRRLCNAQSTCCSTDHHPFPPSICSLATQQARQPDHSNPTPQVTSLKYTIYCSTVYSQHHHTSAAQPFAQAYLVNRVVGEHCAVHAQHLQRQWVCGGVCAQAHQCAGHWDVCVLDELTDLRGRVQAATTQVHNLHKGEDDTAISQHPPIQLNHVSSQESLAHALLGTLAPSWAHRIWRQLGMCASTAIN